MTPTIDGKIGQHRPVCRTMTNHSQESQNSSIFQYDIFQDFNKNRANSSIDDIQKTPSSQPSVNLRFGGFYSNQDENTNQQEDVQVIKKQPRLDGNQSSEEASEEYDLPIQLDFLNN